MAMSNAAVATLVRTMFDTWKAHTDKAKALDVWASGRHRDRDNLPDIPQQAGRDLINLTQLAQGPWGRMVTNVLSENFAITSQYIPDSDEPTTKTFREVWKPSGMQSKQSSLFRGAIGCNLSYAITLPATRPHTDKKTARITTASATDTAAFYEDGGNDEFATFAMQGRRYGEGYEFTVYDEEFAYKVLCEEGGDGAAFLSRWRHGVGVTPVHRFTPELDLEGRARGEIEQLIPILGRLDTGTFHRLTAQQFNIWQVRYIAGMLMPQSASATKRAEMMLRQTDILVSESADTKFGVLPGTDLSPYISGHETDLRDLASLSQVPPHHLLGNISNLSADALAAAEASLMRKVGEQKLSFSESMDRVMRSCAFILHKFHPGEGYEDEATNYDTEFNWKDKDSRSLSQAADALGKIATLLGVPAEMLWEHIPFWKTGDTEKAKNLLAELGDSDEIMREIMKLGVGHQEREAAEREATAEPGGDNGATDHF